MNEANNPHLCEVCGRSFTRRSKFSRHVRNHGEETPYPCLYCSKSYGTERRLNRHLLIHAPRRPFHCDTCGRRFCTKTRLGAHLRLHTGEKPFRCDQCGESYRLKKTLGEHLGTAHARDHPCEICHLRFVDLCAHLRDHAEGPYMCEFCGRLLGAAVLDSHLKRHWRERDSHFVNPESGSRIRADERPYMCEVCGRFFLEEATLNDHLKRHSKERRFCCRQCDLGFDSRGDFDAHLEIHKAEKVFSCRLCGEGFLYLYRGKLLQHVSRVRGK